MALLHLYRTIDQNQAYSDAMFARFALSTSEKRWLNELMVSQRDGLLLFNEQLHLKRRRFIRQALPNARRACADRFEALLDGYVLYSGLEDTSDAANAVRSFADYVGGLMRDRGAGSREHEFIRFEALRSAVSLWQGSSNRPTEPSSDLRLAIGGDAHLVLCDYDVATAMQDLSLLETAGRLATPQWFLLFQDGAGAVRTFAIAPGLAKVLSLFEDGSPLNEVLRRLEVESERDAASRSVAKLLRLGVPFFLPAGPAGRVERRWSDE